MAPDFISDCDEIPETRLRGENSFSAGRKVSQQTKQNKAVLFEFFLSSFQNCFFSKKLLKTS